MSYIKTIMILTTILFTLLGCKEIDISKKKYISLFLKPKIRILNISYVKIYSLTDDKIIASKIINNDIIKMSWHPSKPRLLLCCSNKPKNLKRLFFIFDLKLNTISELQLENAYDAIYGDDGNIVYLKKNEFDKLYSGNYEIIKYNITNNTFDHLFSENSTYPEIITCYNNNVYLKYKKLSDVSIKILSIEGHRQLLKTVFHKRITPNLGDLYLNRYGNKYIILGENNSNGVHVYDIVNPGLSKKLHFPFMLEDEDYKISWSYDDTKICLLSFDIMNLPQAAYPKLYLYDIINEKKDREISPVLNNILLAEWSPIYQ